MSDEVQDKLAEILQRYFEESVRVRKMNLILLDRIDVLSSRLTSIEVYVRDQARTGGRLDEVQAYAAKMSELRLKLERERTAEHLFFNDLTAAPENADGPQP